MAKVRKKSFEEYLTKEDRLQQAVMQYVKLQYPKVFCIHVPNEGRRTPFEQFKAKALGITSGIPDVLIFDSGFRFRAGVTKGLAIELKVKPNKPTSNQLACLQMLRERSWEIAICYSFDEAKEIIDAYLK